jgi:hypothetical protein
MGEGFCPSPLEEAAVASTSLRKDSPMIVGDYDVAVKVYVCVAE